MATQSNALIGWDLIYKIVEDSINQESDLIIALIHWSLIVKGYKCLGIGSDKILLENEESSELLPAGWNDSEIYSLRYVLNDELYILHAVKSDDVFIANFLQVKSQNVTNVAINLDNTVKKLKGPLNSMIPNSQELLTRIRKELIEKHEITTKKEVETQTRSVSFSDNVTVRPEDPYYHASVVIPGHQYGRGDLDPLGRERGGMLFEPPNLFQGNPFPNLRMPGARFDAYNPIGGFGNNAFRGDPDNDHLPPRHPRWNNDDLYM